MNIKDSLQAGAKAIANAASSLLDPKKNAPAAPTPPPEPPKKTGPDPAVPVLLKAWAMPVTNRTLLVAYKPGTDPSNPNNLVSVRVRANHNFIPHMNVRARLVQGTVYDLVGPLPRWRGRM